MLLDLLYLAIGFGVSSRCWVLRQGLRSRLRRLTCDYIIAGIVRVLLFVYLGVRAAPPGAVLRMP